ncbi:MAG: toprim domain-containing protein [Bryobacterales bacterium]|nr:toprim domain-containing protein [Bryobacterales bacterium]
MPAARLHHEAAAGRYRAFPITEGDFHAITPPYKDGAVNASDVAAELAARAEQVCRHFLPHGRRQGRYWVAGDLDGAHGRSLFVRLEGPGTPGKFTDAATGEHGDLLDIVRIRSGAPTLRAALAEARAFLARPAPPATGGGASYDATEAARRLWRRCHAIGGTPAEKYLLARGLARCRFAALRFHPDLRYRKAGSVIRLPALVAAVTGDDGVIGGVQRTWLDPHSPAKANVAAPRKALGRIHGNAVRFGTPGKTLLVGEGIETVLSLVTAMPDITAAAALSAGSLGAFTPPPGVNRLLIARDNDPEGERAAERLALRCLNSGVGFAVLVPESGDFNDDLVAFGPDALAAQLAPLVRFAGGGVEAAWSERR